MLAVGEDVIRVSSYVGHCQYWQAVFSTQVASDFGLRLKIQVYHKLRCDGLMRTKSSREIFEVQVVATISSRLELMIATQLSNC